MPWFLTSLFTDEVAQRSSMLLADRRRTFGFYNTYIEAYMAVKENRMNMQECLYNYLVLEYIEPGIHPTVHAIEWWKWNYEEHKWEMNLDKPLPKEFEGTCNWALG